MKPDKHRKMLVASRATQDIFAQTKPFIDLVQRGSLEIRPDNRMNYLLALDNAREDGFLTRMVHSVGINLFTLLVFLALPAGG